MFEQMLYQSPDKNQEDSLHRLCCEGIKPSFPFLGFAHLKEKRHAGSETIWQLGEGSAVTNRR
jgi:hypothetical protein